MAPSISNILFSFILLAMLAKEVESQNTSFSVNIFTPNSAKLTYERDAIVPPDEPYVRLATSLKGSASVGRVLYNKAVNLWAERKQASFETTVTLRITSDNDTQGHGMTFFIIPVNSTVSTGGIEGNLGIYDAVVPGSPFFAVEFDITTIGDEFDPDYKHIGININSKRSQNTTRVDGIVGERVTARITYDAPTRKINVVATYGSTTSTVSFVFNVAALLPQQVQVGLSASTGNIYVANFDVYTWHFNSTMVEDDLSLAEDNTYIKHVI